MPRCGYERVLRLFVVVISVMIIAKLIQII
jgi:hypothetical protein